MGYIAVLQYRKLDISLRVNVPVSPRSGPARQDIWPQQCGFKLARTVDCGVCVLAAVPSEAPATAAPDTLVVVVQTLHASQTSAWPHRVLPHHCFHRVGSFFHTRTYIVHIPGARACICRPVTYRTYEEQGLPPLPAAGCSIFPSSRPRYESVDEMRNNACHCFHKSTGSWAVGCRQPRA